MTIDILTGFTGIFRGPFSESIVSRALSERKVEIWVHDIRHYTHDHHGKIDDIPYGGGAGMVMMAQPIITCLDKIRSYRQSFDPPRLIYMTPQGTQLNQEIIDSFANEEWLIILCGHYKDVDHRVFERDRWEEVSVGDFVVSGGELPAALLVDAIVRRVPGTLGNVESASSDSFTRGDLDSNYYTKPEIYQGMKVPDVLISGHHSRIAEWRDEQRRVRTSERRPDLLQENNKKKSK